MAIRPPPQRPARGGRHLCGRGEGAGRCAVKADQGLGGRRSPPGPGRGGSALPRKRKTSGPISSPIPVLRRMMSDEPRVLDPVQFLRRQRDLVPEAVAVAQRLELGLQDLEEQRADHCSRDIVLGKATDPEIDVVDANVDRGQPPLHFRIRADLIEAGDPRQSHPSRASL